MAEKSQLALFTENIFGAPPPKGPTLREAREELASKILGGTSCPCCNHHVQLYRRKLNSDMARWLIWLVLTYKALVDWVDVRQSSVRGGDYAKLSHWGLAVSRSNDDPQKRSSGLWRPTPTGTRFAFGKVRVHSHVLLLDNKAKGFTGKPITIQDALGERFDYAQLMGESAEPPAEVYECATEAVDL